MEWEIATQAMEPLASEANESIENVSNDPVNIIVLFKYVYSLSYQCFISILGSFPNSFSRWTYN